MSSKVRQSKFRHVFGEPRKPEQCYSGIAFHPGSQEGNGMVGNSKYVAFGWNTGGGGALCVLPHDKPSRLAGQTPLCIGHTGAVLDYDFNPFNDNQVVSASEDGSLMLWEIPDGGLTENISSPLLKLDGHQKKVNVALFHRSASNILASASYDNTVKIWDLTRGEAVTSVDQGSEMIWSLVWNRVGNLFAAASKDKNVRVCDPRSASVASSWVAHDGSKPVKLVWAGSRDKILTVGCNKQSMRAMVLWDPRNLSQPIFEQQLEAAAGTLVPLWDEDTNVVYLAGKGEASIRYFEISDENPPIFSLSNFSSTKPQRSVCLLPKLAGDVAKCEVARVLRGVGDAIEVVSMIVPRRATEFQEDIFPDTAAPVPALSSDEWFSGSDAEPRLMSCRPGAAVVQDQTPKPKAKTVFQLQKELEEKDALIEQLRAQIAALQGK